jgi:hypothetical protein
MIQATEPSLRSDANLCGDIDRIISVSQRNDSRPIFPVLDAAAILMQRHRLAPWRSAELVALISQRCVGQNVPLAFSDFERIGPF